MSFAADADVPVFVPRVTRVDLRGAYRLAVGFLDGSEQDVDVQPLLHGEWYGPLRDPARFNQVAIDPHGSLTWPNGPTLSLWTLHAWPREGPRLAAQLLGQERGARRLRIFRQWFAALVFAWFLGTVASWAGWLGTDPASVRDIATAAGLVGMATSQLIQKREPVWSTVLNFASLALILAFGLRR